jgi:hypothetical protein
MIGGKISTAISIVLAIASVILFCAHILNANERAATQDNRRFVNYLNAHEESVDAKLKPFIERNKLHNKEISQSRLP